MIFNARFIFINCIIFFSHLPSEYLHYYEKNKNRPKIDNIWKKIIFEQIAIILDYIKNFNRK